MKNYGARCYSCGNVFEFPHWKKMAETKNEEMYQRTYCAFCYADRVIKK